MILKGWPNGYQSQDRWVYHAKRGDFIGRFEWLPPFICAYTFFIPAFVTEGEGIFYRAGFRDGESFEQIVNTNGKMMDIERLEQECREMAETQVTLARRSDELTIGLATAKEKGLPTSFLSAVAIELEVISFLLRDLASYRGCLETRLTYARVAAKETSPLPTNGHDQL